MQYTARERWKAPVDQVRSVWAIYGGRQAFYRSPYLQVALVCTLLMSGWWSSGDRSEWWNAALGIMPNILGFTLGGYAILVGFGDERFKRMISGGQGGYASPFMELSATMAHLLLAQTAAIVIALLGRALTIDMGSQPTGVYVFAVNNERLARVYNAVWGAVGMLATTYAILLIVSCALAIFLLTKQWDDWTAMQREAEQAQEEDHDRSEAETRPHA